MPRNAPSHELPIRPRRAWYGLPCLIFLLGTLGGSAWILFAIHLSSQDVRQFLAPGAFLLETSRAAPYQIWYEAETDFGGTHYATAPSLPDPMDLQVMNQANSNELAVVRAWGLRQTAGSMVRYSVGSFQAPGPATIEIRVTGDFLPRVFSVQPSRRNLMLTAFLGGGLLCVIGAIAGPVLAFLIFVRRGISRRDLLGPDF